MLATILLSALIFGSAAWVIYRQFKGDHCSECPTDCAAKHQAKKS